MLFNTPLFFIFFSVFFVLHRWVIVQAHHRAVLILVASLVFYGGWDYRFIPLLLFSGVVDYFVANGIDASDDKRRRKQLLWLSIATNLSVLLVFKYTNFMLESVRETLALVGIELSVASLNIILPVGISFYTFQSMSYTIDVYRGVTHARKAFTPFIAALCFFPQLVAGPILRASQVLPQFEQYRGPSLNDVKMGFVLIVMGLFKKTCADLLAVPAQRLFDNPEPLSWLEAMTGLVAFAGQIYGDFSGYTDIAIGIALLIGIKIPLNFRTPYFALSMVDFWQRWHISLSHWLRDYLYISLGGNRNGKQARNIIITMLLGGLWHGAAWTYVVWGFYHGVIISLTHQFRASRLGAWSRGKSSRLIKPLAWCITCYLLFIGWILFRSHSLEQAWSLLVFFHLPSGNVESGPLAGIMLALVVVTIVVTHCIDYCIIRFKDNLLKYYWWVLPLLVMALTFSITIGESGHDFIYFQF